MSPAPKGSNWLVLGAVVCMGASSHGALPGMPPPRAARSSSASHANRIPANVVCQPLFVCDVVLDPGETIISMASGDAVRWILNATPSGNSGERPHVLVKATDYGLRTNLIITTDKRTCYLILVSTAHDYQYRTRFYYPIGEVAKIKPLGRMSASLDQVNPERLDLAYRMRGERSFMPLHVLNDGRHTYIQMPDGVQDMPVLYVIGNDGADTVVNYRFHGRSFILDGLPQRMVLVQGSGRGQRRVIIERGN